ncbi:Uncharacterised protein [uncultured archaeon]|nr:Uncharacterised protein [uncultured archaeon]
MNIIPIWNFIVSFIFLAGVIILIWEKFLRKYADMLSYLSIGYWRVYHNAYRNVIKYPENISNGKQKHNAIIVAYTSSYQKPLLYACGIDILIKHFRDKEESYKIYDCNNSEQFRRVVFDKNVKSLYVFGHGEKHDIKLGNEIFHYCELENAPKKEFIAQFHCNHNGGNSLADYLIRNKINRFVSDGTRTLPQNRKDITELCKC